MLAFRRHHQRLNLSPLDRQKSLHDVETLYSLFPGANPDFRLVSGPLPQKEVIHKDSTLASVQERLALNCLLKKFSGFPGKDPRGSAKQAFLKYEEVCSNTNRRLKALRHGDQNPWLNGVLFTAQRKIANVLGDFCLEELLSLSRWGPGSTTSCTGLDVSASAKFKSRPDCTRESLSWLRLTMPLLPSWSALLADQDYGCIVNPMLNVIEGNKVTFVPKTADIDRTIAIEPHLCAFFQNGLGRMIRRRMKMRAHVDLEDQTLNQRLAKQGSIDNTLATIDLEGASDTLSLELVRDLLPEKWFEVLDCFRSHRGVLDGELIRYQKFSSMGNGATFDLESLIFWALSSAVVELEGYSQFWVNVFGDDIIVPSGCYDKVALALTGAGFILNPSKSFATGPFRESCGCDYFNGINVRPIYIKNVPSSSIDWLRIANQIRVLSHRWGNNMFCDTRLLPAYRFAYSRIEKNLRALTVPYAMNGKVGANLSNGILSNFDEACPNVINNCDETQRGFEGFSVMSVGTRSVKLSKTDRSLIVSSIYQPGSTSNDVPMRQKVVYRKEPLFVPGDWYNLGPWSNSALS